MKTACTMIAVVLCLAGAASAQHSDIWVRAEGGQLRTGTFDFGSGTPIDGDLRVFGYDFGEDPDNPFFVQDPGFASGGNGIAGDSRLANFRLGYNVRAGLLYWDGTGSDVDGVSFGATPGGEILRLQVGALFNDVGSGTGFQTGLNLHNPVPSTGVVHRHLGAFLRGPDDSTPPADGIYLLQLELTTDKPGIATSKPFWVVYNNGLDEEQHDLTIDWVQGNLVPEPEALSALTMAAGLLARRRRSGRAG